MRLSRFFTMLGTVIVLLTSQFIGTVSHAWASSGPPSAFLSMHGINKLEDDLSQWGIYHDQAYTPAALESINQGNDTLLKVTLLHGSQPYAGIHAYRNLPAVESATQFSMDISFFYASSDPIQALEFTMNQWVKNVRWEWALQWQVVPDGSLFQAPAKSWRIWTGSGWQNIQVSQNLLNNRWHTLHLYGNIVNGQVHYVGFSCDTIYTDISQYSFAPVANTGDKLAVAMQLDSNYRDQLYSVLYNSVNLHYQ